MTIPYKLVIFDFDGTLADSFGWFLDIFDEVADKFGYDRGDRDNLCALRDMGARELLSHHRVPMWKLPMIMTHVRRLQGQHIDRIALFDGIGEVITTLKRQGVTVAVVTSNARENVETVLGADIATLIDHYACGASLFGKGPKFKALLKSVGLEPGCVLCVGDEIRDIEAGRMAGFKVGAVSWGFANPDRLRRENPDHLFERPQDILKVI
ncbi:HAD hydrolase-like protein [Asticcacaulis sp. ZE23SCel15]|uniref:HAD hydrolase-like protein n=1 Tax=Asticcacaulis sp. ZE23SCel15 TaxID=3059027 RepID=UPI00265E2E11|nr:HAD hydrolase-like protein [Asticcacaulis sp. ZE23SCel15]WKL56662.1 HAD hydrolase-like protein [Asticcacaulis sp. ZE23SCel15]